MCLIDLLSLDPRPLRLFQKRLWLFHRAPHHTSTTVEPALRHRSCVTGLRRLPLRDRSYSPISANCRSRRPKSALF